ncbi:g6013 [Coccomyxa viridis]|uniref:G6013 protein n=1 Tax=Coccomyxa viridis TaxID=1274662 RepID=A0ABP1FUB8_9CHLO
MSRSQPERQGSLHEPLPAEFRPNAAQAGTGSGWPGEQDWEILSAAVRAEADAAALKEHYQLGERGFCGFVHDMARKCSLRQKPGEPGQREALATTESKEQGSQELPKPAQEKPESSTATEQSKPQAPQGSQRSSSAPHGVQGNPATDEPRGNVSEGLQPHKAVGSGVPEEAEPQPARRGYQKRKIWPDQPPIDPEKWSRMSIAEKKEANQALFRKCGYAGNRASLDRMAEYAALAPSTQKPLGAPAKPGASQGMLLSEPQGFQHGSSRDEGMGDDPSSDWMPSDSSDESDGGSGPHGLPQKTERQLVGHAKYLLERFNGECQSYETVTAEELLKAREAYIKRADRALHSLLRGSHAGEDELNKARELIKGPAAKYKRALQRFNES